jgi:hypothetical protein
MSDFFVPAAALKLTNSSPKAADNANKPRRSSLFQSFFARVIAENQDPSQSAANGNESAQGLHQDNEEGVKNYFKRKREGRDSVKQIQDAKIS